MYNRPLQRAGVAAFRLGLAPLDLMETRAVQVTARAAKRSAVAKVSYEHMSQSPEDRSRA